MKIPNLKTKRLLLTIPEKDFAVPIVDYLNKNREFHHPWDPIRLESYFSVTNWEKQLPLHQQEFLEEKAVRFFMIKDNTIIGHCNFSNIIRGPFQCCNLGFSIDKDHEGQGLMVETLAVAIDYVFTELNIHRIQANHLPHNYRSRNLLRKLNFVVEGYAQNYLFICGKWQDHVLNSLANPNWIEK